METFVDIGYTIVRGNSIIMWECLDKVRDIWNNILNEFNLVSIWEHNIEPSDLKKKLI